MRSKKHLPDAAGNVGCETCWSIAACTNGTVTECRWCVAERDGLTPDEPRRGRRK